MEFIEMTGSTLLRLVRRMDEDEDEKAEQLQMLGNAGLTDESIVRVNRQGDIELRRRHQWDVVGGMLGEYDQSVREITGLDWA